MKLVLVYFEKGVENVADEMSDKRGFREIAPRWALGA